MPGYLDLEVAARSGRRDAQGMWLRGGDDPAETRHPDDKSRPAQATQPQPNPRRPAWDASTMTIQTLHSVMVEQGWASGVVPEIPLSDESAEELPNRPLDLGVGWWR